jgi:hypothetical protein
MDPGGLESISAIRKGPPARKIRKTIVFALRTVKSFAVLSIRDRSPGNSEETTPTNRRQTSVGRRIIFPIFVRVDMILQLASQFIPIPSSTKSHKK